MEGAQRKKVRLQGTVVGKVRQVRRVVTLAHHVLHGLLYDLRLCIGAQAPRKHAVRTQRTAHTHCGQRHRMRK